MELINIDLGERSHPIYVGTEILDSFPTMLKKYHLGKRVAIVTDAHIAAIHLKPFSQSLRRSGYDVSEIVIPAGERQKSVTRASAILTHLLKERHTRSSILIAFGGGVVGDVAGFVAATFRRGVPLIHVPTTLLGQVESSIGGKTAVNHPLSKNAMGVFYQPKFIFSDVGLLKTLPLREIICGLGEILKYAILDEEVCRFLEGHLDRILDFEVEVMRKLIVLCNRYKARLISVDERELDPAGGRAVLNLGHTIGHVLEVQSRYRLHHGEAVLIGLKWELIIAHNAHIVDDASFVRINALLSRIDFRPSLGFLMPEQILKSLYAKKELPKFVLPKRIGAVEITSNIRPSIVRSIVKKELE